MNARIETGTTLLQNLRPIYCAFPKQGAGRKRGDGQLPVVAPVPVLTKTHALHTVKGKCVPVPRFAPSRFANKWLGL